MLTYVFAGSPEAAGSLSARHRLWTVLSLSRSSLRPAAVIGLERPLARRFGYVPASARVFATSAPLAVVEWTPAATAAR